MNHRETAYGLLRATMGVIFLFYGVGKFIAGLTNFVGGMNQRFAGKLPAAMVMPAGALVRSVPIISIQRYHPVIELNTSYGEVLTFTVTDNAEIQRVRNLQGERHVTRYDVTFPLGDYFALING